MAELEVKLWRYRCITEGKNIEEWRPGKPTSCHKDPSHEIDINSVAVIGSVTSDVVKAEIMEEDVETGHHYRTYTAEIKASPGQIDTRMIAFGFPISIMCGGVHVDSDGDEIQLAVYPGRPLGKLNAPASHGDSEISVIEGVIDNACPGYIMTLEEGSNKENFYVNKVMDLENKLKISALQNAYTVNADITMTRRMLHSGLGELAIVPKGLIRIGDANIRSTHIPAGAPIVAYYKNNSDSEGHCIFYIEYFF